MSTQFNFYTDEAEYYEKNLKQGEKFIKEYYLPILRNLKAKTILDIGCGPGTARILVEKGYNVVGIDQSPKFVEIASKYFPAVLDDMRTLGHVRTKFKDLVPFDAAISVFTTVPHLLNPYDIIEHFRAVRKTAKMYVFDFPSYVNLLVSGKFEYAQEKYIFDRVGRVILELKVNDRTYQIPQALLTPLFVDTIAPLTGWRVKQRLADGEPFNAKDRIIEDVKRFVYVLERKNV